MTIYKPRFESRILKCISWLIGSCFWGLMNAAFWKRGFQDLSNGTKVASQLGNLFFRLHICYNAICHGTLFETLHLKSTHKNTGSNSKARYHIIFCPSRAWPNWLSVGRKGTETIFFWNPCFARKEDKEKKKGWEEEQSYDARAVTSPRNRAIKSYKKTQIKKNGARTKSSNLFRRCRAWPPGGRSLCLTTRTRLTTRGSRTTKWRRGNTSTPPTGPGSRTVQSLGQRRLPLLSSPGRASCSVTGSLPQTINVKREKMK